MSSSERKAPSVRGCSGGSASHPHPGRSSVTGPGPLTAAPSPAASSAASVESARPGAKNKRSASKEAEASSWYKGYTGRRRAVLDDSDSEDADESADDEVEIVGETRRPMLGSDAQLASPADNDARGTTSGDKSDDEEALGDSDEEDSLPPSRGPAPARRTAPDSDSDDILVEDSGGQCGPCEFCDEAVPLADLEGHQLCCPARHGAAGSSLPPDRSAASARSSCPRGNGNATSRSSSGGEQRPSAPCSWCGLLQPLDRLDNHEAACEARSTRRANARPSGPSLDRLGGTGRTDDDVEWGMHAAAGRPQQRIPQASRGKGTSLAMDDISDSSGDDDPPLPASWASRAARNPTQPPSKPPNAQPELVPRPSIPPPLPAVGPASNEQRALMAAFPHFTSLASIRAQGMTTRVDFLGQFSDTVGYGGGPSGPSFGGGMASTSGGFDAQQPAQQGSYAQKRSKGKGTRGGKKSLTNAWRTDRNGNKVYHDARGQKKMGKAAYLASKKKAKK